MPQKPNKSGRDLYNSYLKQSPNMPQIPWESLSEEVQDQYNEAHSKFKVSSPHHFPNQGQKTVWTDTVREYNKLGAGKGSGLQAKFDKEREEEEMNAVQFEQDDNILSMIMKYVPDRHEAEELQRELGKHLGELSLIRVREYLSALIADLGGTLGGICLQKSMNLIDVSLLGIARQTGYKNLKVREEFKEITAKLVKDDRTLQLIALVNQLCTQRHITTEQKKKLRTLLDLNS